MKTTSMSQRWEAQRARRRQLAGVVGVMVGTLVVSLVTVMFDSVSHMPWLAPTQANQKMMARCDETKGTSARHRCVEDAVARALAAGTEVQVAESAASRSAQ